MIKVDATIASEQPVDGTVLPMSAGDFTRVAQGAVPLLLNHANDAHGRIGNVEAVRVEGDELKATLSIMDDRLERQINAGVNPNLSIGYLPGETTRREDGVEVAGGWELIEVSLVGSGVDPIAGVNRSMGETIMQTRTMPQAENPQAVPQQTDPAALERARVRGILDVAGALNVPAVEVNLAVAAGDSLAEFERRVRGLPNTSTRDKLTEFGEFQQTAPAVVRRESIGDPDAFSLRSLFLAMADGERCRELERCGEATTQGGKAEAARGRSAVSIPAEIVRDLHTRASEQGQTRTRTLTVAGTNAGAELVGTQHLASEFVAPLREQTWLSRAGVRVLDGLMQDVDIPGQSGVAQASWLTPENQQLTESELDTATILSLSPKEVGVLSSYSRKLLIQSSPGVEGLVVDDQRQVLDRAIEVAVLNGTGASGQPTGIDAIASGDVALNVSNTNGTDVDFSRTASGEVGFVQMLQALDGANIDPMRASFLTSGRGYWKLASQLVGTNTAAIYLVRNGTAHTGNAVMATNLIASQVTKGSASNTTRLYLADWSHCYVARWSGLDVLIDPYTAMDSRKIRVATYSDIDTGWRHKKAIVRVTDFKH